MSWRLHHYYLVRSGSCVGGAGILRWRCSCHVIGHEQHSWNGEVKPWAVDCVSSKVHAAFARTDISPFNFHVPVQVSSASWFKGFSISAHHEGDVRHLLRWDPFFSIPVYLYQRAPVSESIICHVYLLCLMKCESGNTLRLPRLGHPGFLQKELQSPPPAGGSPDLGGISCTYRFCSCDFPHMISHVWFASKAGSCIFRAPGETSGPQLVSAAIDWQGQVVLWYYAKKRIDSDGT